MNKTLKKITSLFLSVIMLFSLSSFAFASEIKASCGGKCDITPSIVIPGLFQCETVAFDENGDILTDSNGNRREGPFFLDTNEVIISALSNALIPLSKTLIDQKDEDGKFGKALGKVLGDALMGRVVSDENGKLLHSKAVEYKGSVASLPDYSNKWVYDNIPLHLYSQKAGEDHLYYYSYSSFGNMLDIADGLYAFIKQVREETGHDKVNIVPISQGGAVCNALLEFHKDVVNDLNRIVYIIPASDGSDVIGDIYAYGLNDTDDALYDYMIPSLFEGQEWIGYLANLLLRLFPKETLNSVLDTAVDVLISDYLINSTAIWALIPQDSYLIAREKYLNDGKHNEIMRQTDLFCQAQKNARQNILDAKNAGVTVFDICGYNVPLFSIAKSWDTQNADGVIQLDSTSFGATSLGVNKPLPEGYVQQNTHIADGTCSNPKHNHIDPYNLVDASTGLLPDNTFYFYNQSHVKTAGCDTVINLAVRLLLDETFTDVYSHPDEYLQFNNFVVTKDLKRHMEILKNLLDTGKMPEAYVEKAEKAIDEAEKALAMTQVDVVRFNEAQDNLDKVYEEILMTDDGCAEALKKERLASIFDKFFSVIMKIVNTVLRRFFGDKGFSE